MILIQNASAEHSTVAVSSVINSQGICQVVDVGELWTISLVITCHQHIDLVSVTSAQVVSQVLSGEMSGSLWTKLVSVSHFVEQNVFGNVLYELNCVAGIAHSANHQRVGDFEDLVFILKKSL